MIWNKYVSHGERSDKFESAIQPNHPTLPLLIPWFQELSIQRMGQHHTERANTIKNLAHGSIWVSLFQEIIPSLDKEGMIVYMAMVIISSIQNRKPLTHECRVVLEQHAEYRYEIWKYGLTFYVRVRCTCASSYHEENA
jgi:hypothetical protein